MYGDWAGRRFCTQPEHHLLPLVLARAHTRRDTRILKQDLQYQRYSGSLTGAVV
jgi:hypothetical protein